MKLVNVVRSSKDKAIYKNIDLPVEACEEHFIFRFK